MRTLVVAWIVIAVMLTGCGDASDGSPGDQPKGTQTSQEDNGDGY